MSKFHSHDGLLWAIRIHTELLAQTGKREALRTVADVHGCLLSFVGCYFVVVFPITLVLQTIANYLPYLCLNDTNLHHIQLCLNKHDAPLTARRAMESLLPHMFVNCKQQKTLSMDNDWPVRIMADGCSRKHNVRFECILGLFSRYIFSRIKP